jgi:hypothetical protein
MDTLSEVSYTSAKINYERALARRDYAEAKRYIETMIETAPCAEALPTLSGWLADVETRIRQAKPFFGIFSRRAQ